VFFGELARVKLAFRLNRQWLSFRQCRRFISHDAMRPKERFSRPIPQLWQNNARVTNASSIYQQEQRYLSATMRQIIDALARAFI